MIISALDWSSSEELQHRVTQARRAIAKHTELQRHLLQALLHGNTNKQIAREHGIRNPTVENHRACMMDRLRAKSTADAVRIAIYAEIEGGD